MNAPDPADRPDDEGTPGPQPPPQPEVSGPYTPSTTPGQYAPPAAPGQFQPGQYAPPHAPAQYPPGQYAPPPAPAQYPPGQYAAPGQPVPGMYSPSQYAPGQFAPGQYPMPYPTQPSNGTLAWVLGFLIFVPIPFLSAIISGVAMALPVGALSRKGAVAAANARSAANWGLTYVTVSTVLLLSHFIALAALDGSDTFFPIGIPITLYLAVGVLHIVLVIVGTVRSSKGDVMRVPFAIPYLRG